MRAMPKPCRACRPTRTGPDAVASLVGQEHALAGTDCGFDVFARVSSRPHIVRAKYEAMAEAIAEAMAEGARRASRQLKSQPPA